MEKTVILLKPDCYIKRRIGEVIARFEKAGFTIRAIKTIAPSESLLREHYAHIADKPFFPEVVEFMQSAPVVAMAIEGDNIIARMREMLGPTDSTQAAPGTIRGDMGDDKMKNIAHASDSPEAAESELKRFFSPGEIL